VTNPPASTTETLSVAIAAEGLGKTIDDKRILHDLHFSIDRGRYAALLGANGAGKSTLLKLLATLIPPSNGTLRIFEADPRRATMRGEGFSNTAARFPAVHGYGWGGWGYPHYAGYGWGYPAVGYPVVASPVVATQPATTSK
jgi:energy-coupling factor transporter ATP-binding protein EcfA2